MGGGGRCEPVGMSDNWNKDLASEVMKAKVNMKCHASFSLGQLRLARTLTLAGARHFAILDGTGGVGGGALCDPPTP